MANNFKKVEYNQIRIQTGNGFYRRSTLSIQSLHAQSLNSIMEREGNSRVMLSVLTIEIISALKLK